MNSIKLLDKTNPENTIVRVVFRGKFNEEYECAGVLMIEKEGLIRVAFGAKNDIVVDYVDIKRKDIVSITIVNPSDVKKL